KNIIAIKGSSNPGYYAISHIDTSLAVLHDEISHKLFILVNKEKTASINSLTTIVSHLTAALKFRSATEHSKEIFNRLSINESKPHQIFDIFFGNHDLIQVQFSDGNSGRIH